jgi:hypothetical protein
MTRQKDTRHDDLILAGFKDRMPQTTLFLIINATARINGRKDYVSLSTIRRRYKALKELGEPQREPMLHDNFENPNNAILRPLFERKENT